MERRQIGLKLVMDQLGLTASVGTFEDRLILQKAVYLSQAAGVNLGYYYRWYLYGPYCPSVAEDGFALSIELSDTNDPAKDWALDPSSKTRLQRIRKIVSGIDRERLARKLELLASVHFLIERGQVANRSPKEIKDTLERFGKQFKEKEVADAIGEMSEHGVIS